MRSRNQIINKREVFTHLTFFYHFEKIFRFFFIKIKDKVFLVDNKSLNSQSKELRLKINIHVISQHSITEFVRRLVRDHQYPQSSFPQNI